MAAKLSNFTDVLGDAEEICDSQVSQPLSLSSTRSIENHSEGKANISCDKSIRPAKGTGQYNEFRSVDEIDSKYRDVFSYPFFNLVQSRVIEDALYSDKSMVVCAPTGSGKTVIFEMAMVQLLMEIEDKNINEDYKIIYMAPVKALCTERLTEWYSKFTKLGLLCIEVTGDTDVDFSQLQPYRIIITTPEKWDMLTRRWRDHRGLVEMIKLFLIDEVHILNDESRGPVLEAVVSRMKTIQASAQSAYRIEKIQKQYQNMTDNGVLDLSEVSESCPRIRFVAVSATVSNPEDVAAWLGTDDKPAVYYKFGDECRPVKLRRVVEGYPCSESTSIFKFDIILNYKLWPIIQKYHNGKPTLIFCNTRKSVLLTAETLSREITVTFSNEQKAKLNALASTIKNKKFQSLVLAGVGCHHAGMLFEERTNIEHAFRNGDLPILITTTTLAMGVNLPAHLVIIKNTQQYVNGAYQEYSISTVLQMVGRAGRPQFDTDATAVIMTRQKDKARYQALAGGSEPLQSYLHKRLAENLNSETALGTVGDVAQCVEWLRSTFLYVRAAKDPKRYLGLTAAAPDHLILKKVEELCVIAMNGLASAGLITMDEASCISATEAGQLMSLYYLDLETMKHIMTIQGNESLERLVWIISECHELADMHLRTDERRVLNALNRNNTGAAIRFPMKGKITTRQMKLSCIIQAILGCLPIPEPSLNQEAMKVMRIADRICKCLVAYVTRPEPISEQRQYFAAILNSIILAKCVTAHLWETSPYVSKQLKGIGPTFSTLLATAGKVNFMLLEESHPRDLERIMNKGPPAGNILRKQISLLPKYQLLATPIDEKTVSVKLQLLNQAYLAENIEHLTAGKTHRCFLVAGDSENHILLLRSFTDKDLISVYDGGVTSEITRKVGFEHKIFVHCISSKFAGVDVQCEYTFTSLIPASPRVDTSSFYFNKQTQDITTKQAKRQTTITDTFRERKRKNCSNEIVHSKEKKKRENALAEKFRLLKESFGRTSINIKKDLQKTQEISNNVLNDLTDKTEENDTSILDNDARNIHLNENFNELNPNDEFMDDVNVDSILNEIESEITKTNVTTRAPQYEYDTEKTKTNYLHWTDACQTRANTATYTSYPPVPSPKRKLNKVSKKPNYNFLELLEKNSEISDEEELRNENGFAETIKSQIEKYLKHSCKIPNYAEDLTIKELCEKDKESSISCDFTRSNSEKQDQDLLSNSMTIQCLNLLEGIDAENEISKEENLVKSSDQFMSTSDENLIITTKSDEVKSVKALEVGTYDLNQENNSDREDRGQTDLGTSTISSGKFNCNSNTENIISTAFLSPVEKKRSYGTNAIHFAEKKTDSKKHFENQDLPLVSLHNLHIPPPMTNELIPYNINVKSALPWQTQEVKLSTMKPTKCPLPQIITAQLPALRSLNPNDFVNSHSMSTALMHFQSSTVPLNGMNCLQLANQEITMLDDPIEKVLDAHMAEVQDARHLNFRGSAITNEQSKPNMIISSGQNYTNNLELNNKGDEKYEENYSFKAEKVDIHTQFTKDHKIQVIRRLKVDLDVRKILSSVRHEQNAEASAEKVYCNKADSSKSLNQQHTITHNHNNEIASNTGHSICLNESKDIEKPLEVKKAIKESLEIDMDKTSLPLNGKVDEENETKNNQTPTHEENNVSNILQKFSRIIGKKKTCSSKLPVSQNSINTNFTTKMKPFKSKRPFKISEIQNINVPLPTLYQNINTTNSAETLPSNQNPNISCYASRGTTLPERPGDLTSQIPEELEEHSNEQPEKRIQLTPCHTPEPLFEQALEISEDDLKLDQSMFNPKTLLQSMRQGDDAIIAPPPEFGDNDFCHSYSPEKTDYFEKDITTQPHYFESMRGQRFEEERDNDETIFDDRAENGLDLTPSKEVETWTLSPNDEYESCSLATPSQSRTVMHKKMYQNQSEKPLISSGRQGRLSAFKFNRKSKLKM